MSGLARAKSLLSSGMGSHKSEGAQGFKTKALKLLDSPAPIYLKSVINSMRFQSI
jgi:hypothetical protein